MFLLPDFAALIFKVGAAEGYDLLILILKSKFKRSQPSAAPTQDVFYSAGNYWLHRLQQQFKVYQPVSFACDYRTLWRFDELTIFRPLPTIDVTLSPQVNLRSQCLANNTT
jgi:hypothetical protein